MSATKSTEAGGGATVVSGFRDSRRRASGAYDAVLRWCKVTGVSHRALPTLVFGVLVAVPASVFAGNGLEPRTPVAWPEETACLTVVDRSQAVMLHMGYGVPFEDVGPTEDEVADSRRHQFVAFCRDHSREEFLPIWLTWKDIEAAAAKDLIDPLTVEDEDVLETSTVWKDCWFRITADDARRPITFAEAMKGVDWDTTALIPGAYIVQGYTWEPWVNIYSQRPGVVQVVDGPDLTALGPAAAVATTLDYTFAEDPFVLEGCARGLPGSSLSGYWALTGGDGMLEWAAFAEDVPLDGESWVLPFLPPPVASGQTVALRVDVTDPMQRTFSAYPLNLLTVLPGSSNDGTTGCEPEASFVVMPCDSEGGEPAATSTGLGTSDTGVPGTSGSGGGTGDATTAPGATLATDTGGCSCVASAPSQLAWAGVVVLGLWRRRRRR